MSTPRDNQLNVLVIDDNADVRELLVEVISRYDHQVVPASSAEEALALLPYWTFEVAFLGGASRTMTFLLPPGMSR